MNNKFKKLDIDWTNVSNASRKAHKGTHLSKAHKRHIKNGMREFKEAKDGTILEAIKVGEDTQIKYFTTAAEAARFLGCSRQLISQCLRLGKGPNGNCSAKGWVFKRIKIEDMLIGKEAK